MKFSRSKGVKHIPPKIERNIIILHHKQGTERLLLWLTRDTCEVHALHRGRVFWNFHWQHTYSTTCTFYLHEGDLGFLVVQVLETTRHKETVTAAKWMGIYVIKLPSQSSDFLFHLHHTCSRRLSKILTWTFSTVSLGMSMGTLQGTAHQHLWYTNTTPMEPQKYPKAKHFSVRNSTVAQKSNIMPEHFFWTEQAQVTEVSLKKIYKKIKMKTLQILW